MRVTLLLLLLSLAACAGESHELPYTSTSAPIWSINPVGITTENDLTSAPTRPSGIIARAPR